MGIRVHRGERGANLVEAALVIPLLLLLLTGVIDMGRAYYTYITVINAAREGARYGVSHYSDHAGIQARVRSEAALSNVDLSAATITIDEHGTGIPVRVTVDTTFYVILGGVLGQPSFPIRYSVAFRAR